MQQSLVGGADPMSNDTYYTVLGVSQTASQLEIRAAYRSLLKKVHPDTVSALSLELRHLAEGATRDITEAYSVLSDPKKRRQYDRELGLVEHRLKSIRPPTTPGGPLCTTNTASTSAADIHSRRKEQIHGDNRRPSLKTADKIVAILVAFFILVCLVVLGTLLIEMSGTPQTPDESRVFTRVPSQKTETSTPRNTVRACVTGLSLELQ